MNSVAEVVFKELPEDEEYIALVEQVLQKCFEVEEINPLQFYICVTLTNPKNIHIINKQYRNVDRPTDVLSFPMFEGEELKTILEQEQKPEDITGQDILGDIIISIEKIKEQAVEYGHSFEREFAYMLVHGFYHLMGYDHMEEEEKAVMREKEENVLSKLDLKR
ncbi:MAG: rRNA maturation RNase YbeY [Clostridia bacterium]|nr:rRNA maturation RNase YbeY [Clostridia bacterium]